MHAPLGNRQIVGYGVGDFAMNLYWSGTAFFLLYWYTDVAGLPNATAGFLFFVGSVWDAVTDPLMGVLAERTRTRWGRYRPYLLLGSVPLAASFVLLLWVPPLEGAALTGMLIAAHLLFRTAYTVVGVPYSALSARLTQSSGERTRLAGARMLAAASGGLIISASAFPLVHWLGAGQEAAGFLWLGVIAGVIAVAVHILCFMSVREPDTGAAAVTPPFRLADIASMVRHNGPFMLVFGAILLLSSSAVLSQKNVLYYMKYALDAHDRQHLAVLATGLTTLAMIPLWTFVAGRIGKRACWLVATAIAMAGQIALFFSPVPGLVVFLGFLVLIAIGSSAYGVLFWSMLPDTVEYGQWRTGVRSEAIVFGFTTFAQKVSIGIAGWILGYLLDTTGYVSGAVQTAETIDGIKLIMTLLPCALLGLGGLLIYRYPIDAKLHARMLEEIESGQRDASAAAQAAL